VSRRADQIMFAISAVYTSSIALSVLAAPAWASEAFYRHVLQPDETVMRILANDFGGLLLFFGIGYGVVAIDPSKNRALVWLGLFGKIALVLSMSQRFVAGIATHLALSAAGGDLIFVALYAAFLWRTRRAGPPVPV
jgi:hypothetical protein